MGTSQRRSRLPASSRTHRNFTGATAKLSREQKGQFIALCWITQIYKHFPEPKPSYVADWDDLPQWQRETDADIFERIAADA